MDIAMELMSRIQAVVTEVVLWQRSTQMCSRDAHEFMYVLVFGWMVLLIFSVWLYRRINPPKSKESVSAPVNGSQEHLEPPTNPL